MFGIGVNMGIGDLLGQQACLNQQSQFNQLAALALQQAQCPLDVIHGVNTQSNNDERLLVLFTEE